MQIIGIAMAYAIAAARDPYTAFKIMAIIERVQHQRFAETTRTSID
jgi:hypothetical protein